MANQRRKDALAWGIILILLGLLILFANIGYWNFWEFLARLWPVILIIWGSWKLYFGLKERQQSSRD